MRGEEKVDILVVDDDAVAGQLTRDLLAEAGFSVFLLKKSLDAIPTIKRKRPSLVLLDIMAGPINGLRLLKLIKANPEIKDSRVVIVSQKAFDFEKQEAFRLGAEAFIAKPYNVETFAPQINHMLAGNRQNLVEMYHPMEPESMQEANIPRPEVREGEIKIRIWGHRSQPGLIPDTPSVYGRQTACVSVETPGAMIILDAGTGIIKLGESLAGHSHTKDMWLLLSHFHLGHIGGLAGFEPVYTPGFTLRIAGAADSEKRFKDNLGGLFYSNPYWTQRHPRARLFMYELTEDSYDLSPEVKLSVLYANHPTSTLAFRLTCGGRKIVYAPDSQLPAEPTAMEEYSDRLARFAQGADVLFHDSTFTDADAEARAHEGHSGVSAVVSFAAEKAHVRKLVLFHTHSSYSDTTLDSMMAQAARLISENRWPLLCELAREGTEITLETEVPAA